MGALEDMGKSIERALDECSTADVLGVLTGVFVGLAVELVRRQGHDTNEQIKIDGGNERDITIHSPKKGGA